jgi:hypothetical protein
LSHSPARVPRIIQFDLGRTVGASGAHVATIVLVAAHGYGTKRLISVSFANVSIKLALSAQYCIVLPCVAGGTTKGIIINSLQLEGD